MEADYEKLFRELTEKMRSYGLAEEELEKVKLAYETAQKAHSEQKRQSGEPYIIHPLHVALILADLQMDAETIEAALLHDVAEDTEVTLEDIRSLFGDEVSELVDGVTKLKQLSYKATDKEELQAENYRKLFIAMAKDIRVILIKLADRLHNMRTLEYKSKEKQREKARETLDIYSPIANRLGISAIKVELDDLSLKYLEPEAYYNLVEQVSERMEEREESIATTVEDIRKALEEAGIDAKVNGRRKHYFSIYKKMVTKEKSIDQIYDIVAIRAIVDSLKDCYGALGIIHEKYTPMPGRFKDYIAMPKVNMYQSLHTTVIGPGGEPFEVQIRTKEMHRTAEYGIAAHWLYKEESGGHAPGQEEKMKWLQKILDWQQDVSDGREFVDALKQDLNLFRDSVYCFSPKGEVISLPAGATPIDFAYMIHSAVGNKMVGAKVNDRIVTLDYVLENGDRVEIMTSQNSKGPSRDWLKIAQTSQARSKINQWFKKEYKQENIQKGRDMVERYIKAKGLPAYSELVIPEWTSQVLHKYGFMDWDSILATVGHGGLKEGQVVNRLYEEYVKTHPVEITDEEILAEINRKRDGENRRSQSSGTPIMVHGIHDVDVHFSRCCRPLPGDEIVGYVTRGRGVSIHRIDCVNVLNMPAEERKRLIEAEWEENRTAGEKYLASVQIEAKDQPGMLANISACISNLGISIDSLSARRTKDKTGSIFNLSVEIVSKEQLEQMISKLEQLSGVHEIIRTTV